MATARVPFPSGPACAVSRLGPLQTHHNRQPPRKMRPSVASAGHARYSRAEMFARFSMIVDRPAGVDTDKGSCRIGWTIEPLQAIPDLTSLPPIQTTARDDAVLKALAGFVMQEALGPGRNCRPNASSPTAQGQPQHGARGIDALGRTWPRRTQARQRHISQGSRLA
jgi:hypothetical protein